MVKIISEKTVNQHLTLYDYWFQYKNFEIFLSSPNTNSVNLAIDELSKIPKIVSVFIQDKEHTLNFEIRDIISMVKDSNGIIKEINIANGDRLVCKEINEDSIIYGYVEF